VCVGAKNGIAAQASLGRVSDRKYIQSGDMAIGSSFVIDQLNDCIRFGEGQTVTPRGGCSGSRRCIDSPVMVVYIPEVLPGVGVDQQRREVTCLEELVRHHVQVVPHVRSSPSQC